MTSAPTLARRLAAEFLGSAFLAAIVIGSGIAAQRLSPGNTGLQLLENAAAAAAGLFAIILMFGPVSGAHFNPVVSFADAAGIRPGGGRRLHRGGGIAGVIIIRILYPALTPAQAPASSFPTGRRTARVPSGTST